MEDFVIPVQREDLLRRSSVNQYVVDDIISIRSLANRIPECRRRLHAEGHTFILGTFDTIFSVLHHWLDLDTPIKEDAWEILLKACKDSVKQVADMMDETIDRDSLSANRKAIKMNVYLLGQFIELFENDLNSQNTSTTGKGRGRKKKQAASAMHLSMNWERECEHAVQTLNQLFKLNIQQLWDPPIVEDEFVNVASSICYKLLENVAFSKHPAIRVGITSTLASLIRRHNHDLACKVKLTQLLHCFPHMVPALLAITRGFMDTENLRPVVIEILGEICSYSGSTLERDTQAAHSFSQFLQDIAAAYPSLGQTILPLLKSRLEEDPYTMRNCALVVMGEVVLRVYANKEQLEQQHRNQRDKLFEVLEEHIHDVNGFVRSKVLSIWLNIVTAGALPVRRQSRLVNYLVGPQGAILDSTCQARRNAIKILTAMITHNPAARLSYEELNETLEKEVRKLEELESNQEYCDPAVLELEKKWMAALKPLRRALVEGAIVDEFEVKIEDDDQPDVVAERVHKLLHENEFRQAIQLFTLARDAFPMSPLFCDTSRTDKEDGSEDEDSEESIKRKLVLWILKLQNIFMMTLAQPNGVDETDGPGGTQASQQDPVAELVRQRGVVEYLQESTTFAGRIQEALPHVAQMLGSKTPTDIMEAIEFFVCGRLSGVPNTESGVRKMLALVWSKETSVKDAVVEAYRRLYMHPDADNERTKSLSIANSLAGLISGATLGDLLSIEKLVCEFLDSGDIATPVTQVLWEKFTRKLKGTTKEESKAALILLGMAASAVPDIIKSNVELLVKEGLSGGTTQEEGADATSPDLELVMYTCMALQKMAGETKVVGSDKIPEPRRLPQDHAMFTELCSILVTTINHREDKKWIPMMEQAVNTIYALSEHPDILCAGVIRQLAKTLLSEEKENLETDQSEQSGESSGSSKQNLQCPADLLARFLSLSGHVALKQLVHMDVAILMELKRRNTVREENETNKKKKKKPTSRASGANKNDTTANPEEEMGLAGATADDVEAEYIRRLCDSSLVTDPEHLLARLAPLVVHVCSNIDRYRDNDLQAAATLSLSKFMLVSSEFCENNLPLLFTLAERSQTEVIRANLIVALGDLTKRFPNLIEPWTPHLYARLRDNSSKVRLNALNTLSHLILNDMVKVKGQISAMTTCIVDEQDRIVHLAKLFFHELAQKGNALYNVMPDIISRLSDTEVGVGVEENSFQTIMDYLFPYIQKERLCEALVDKLCMRFRATENERQWRDLAYCLSLMSYNEKMIHRLHESVPMFLNKLHVREVYARFCSIITSAKKNIKGDAVTLVEELQTKIDEFHDKGVADEEAIQKAEKAAAEARARRKSSRRSRGAASQSQRNLHSPTATQQRVVNEGDSGESPGPSGSPQGRAKRPRGADTATEKQGRTRGNTRAARRRVFDSDDESD